jgi:hypothetical protein
MFYVPPYELQPYLIGCEFRHSLIGPIFKGQEVVVVAAVVDLVVIFGVGVPMAALCHVTVRAEVQHIARSDAAVARRGDLHRQRGYCADHSSLDEFNL